jgi:hypothetical protein
MGHAKEKEPRAGKQPGIKQYFRIVTRPIVCISPTPGCVEVALPLIRDLTDEGASGRGLYMYHDRTLQERFPNRVP